MTIRIAIDAMGGDNAPQAIVEGAVAAVKEYGVDLILSGKRELIENELKKYDYDKTKIEILHASDIIDTEEKPVSAIRRKKESSLVKAIEMVKDGKAGAVVSAGNTGALLAGGTLIIGRIKGVKRPCLCPGIPNKNGGLTLLADAGANADCKAEYLDQFAKMAYIYARDVLGKENPRVSLVSNGSEAEKGNSLTIEAHGLLKEDKFINFLGNIEPRDVLDDKTDVIVCDGFTGNVILKTSEGVASTLMSMLKGCIMSSVLSKFAGLLLKNSLKQMKGKFDYTEYGGAPLLGVRGGVIKAHGSSDSKAIKNAIRQAKLFIENGVVSDIESAIAIANDLGVEED